MSHHNKQLADNNRFIKLIFNFRKVFFVVPNTLVVNDKDTKAIVVTVHQNSFWDLKPIELRNLSEFFVIDYDILVFGKSVVLIEEANVY